MSIKKQKVFATVVFNPTKILKIHASKAGAETFAARLLHDDADALIKRGLAVLEFPVQGTRSPGALAPSLIFIHEGNV